MDFRGLGRNDDERTELSTLPHNVAEFSLDKGHFGAIEESTELMREEEVDDVPVQTGMDEDDGLSGGGSAEDLQEERIPKRTIVRCGCGLAVGCVNR